MKPPRYLLREAAVRPLARDLAPADVLELGYGRGEMLLTLANLLRWVRALLYIGRNSTGASRDQRRQQIESSGFVPAPGWAQVGTALLNSCLIRPFVWLQHLFRNTRAGTGFVVVASPRQD